MAFWLDWFLYVLSGRWFLPDVRTASGGFQCTSWPRRTCQGSTVLVDNTEPKWFIVKKKNSIKVMATKESRVLGNIMSKIQFQNNPTLWSRTNKTVWPVATRMKSTTSQGSTRFIREVILSDEKNKTNMWSLLGARDVELVWIQPAKIFAVVWRPKRPGWRSRRLDWLRSTSGRYTRKRQRQSAQFNNRAKMTCAVPPCIAAPSMETWKKSVVSIFT